MSVMNQQSRSDSYAAAGVDITAGYKAVELMKTHIAKTMTAGALSDIGGFGGLFALDLTGITHPVLVSGTDANNGPGKTSIFPLAIAGTFCHAGVLKAFLKAAISFSPLLP